MAAFDRISSGISEMDTANVKYIMMLQENICS